MKVIELSARDEIEVAPPRMSYREWLIGQAVAGIAANPAIYANGGRPAEAADWARQLVEAVLAGPATQQACGGWKPPF